MSKREVRCRGVRSRETDGRRSGRIGIHIRSLGCLAKQLDVAYSVPMGERLEVRRNHALAVRVANDGVLQRLFAAGLRLQMLQRRLDTTDAHAASAIAFQLDQAATDLRELILGLNAFIEETPEVDAVPAF